MVAFIGVVTSVWSILVTLIKEDEKSFIFAVFPRMHIEYDQFQVQHYSVIGNLYSAAQSVLREFDFMNHHYDMVYHHEKNTPYKHFQIIVYVQKEASSSVDTSM